MRINICEVTFNTEFAPKKFGSRTFFKISGVVQLLVQKWKTSS